MFNKILYWTFCIFLVIAALLCAATPVGLVLALVTGYMPLAELNAIHILGSVGSLYTCGYFIKVIREMNSQWKQKSALLQELDT